MAKMYFLLQLQEYLLSNNFIYTVRKYRYSDKPDIVFIPGVGACHRELIRGNVTKNDLQSYSGSSGFASLEDWWNMIIKINPSLPKLYLYYVCIVRRTGRDEIRSH